jgi:putative hydrolase of the HAD superfamily
MPYKAYLFDADGVVIRANTFSVQYQADFNIDPNIMQPFFEGPFQDCLVGRADLKTVVAPYLEAWEWKGGVDEFLAYWFKAEHVIDERLVAFIRERRAAGCRCYLATNQERYRTEYMRSAMGFAELFDRVFSSAEIGVKKPEPAFYLAVLDEFKQAGIKPKDVFHIDDSAANIEAAAALGMNGHRYADFGTFIGAYAEVSAPPRKRPLSKGPLAGAR